MTYTLLNLRLSSSKFGLIMYIGLILRRLMQKISVRACFEMEGSLKLTDIGVFIRLNVFALEFLACLQFGKFSSDAYFICD